ncbi:MAG: outer membrane protein transport protein [Melioribacteraceae bacterium]|nr:outer membrane protein transport protein [Melioribacteraceae bacterium]
MNSKKFKIFITLLFLIGTTITAGIPSFFPVSSSKSMSLNGIYAAGSDGISSLSTNPAGLSQLNGRAIEFSVFGRLGQQDYVNTNETLFRSFRDDDIGFNIGAFWKITDDVTVAVDYNNAVQYRVNWPFAKFFQGDSNSAVLAFDHFNDFSITSINPSAAVSFGNISVGASVNILNIKHKAGFYQGDPNWEATVAGLGGYQVDYSADAWTFGGTLGIQADLTTDLRIGAYVKSTISASLEGDAQSRMLTDLDSTVSKTSLSTDFELPWVFGLGVLYNLSDNLKLNVDALYSLWSGTQSVQNYSFGNEIWNNRFSSVDSISGYKAGQFQLQYENSFNLGVGLEYFPSSSVTLRFGYRYSQTHFSEATYNMLYPAVDQHWLSFGVGFWFEELYMDLAIAYAAGIERTVDQNSNFFYPGNYNGNAFVPSMNMKYQF